MRYLTKSRFKLATECPTKLYYTGKDEYANQDSGNTFLAALSQGGYQVGELAKYYFPGGHDVLTLGHDQALQQTNELLKQDRVVIYEAAVCFKNLFIRVDVLVKHGAHIELIEVKAKSIDLSKEEPFSNKNGTIKADWKPHLYDVAFQKWVIRSSFPEWSVSAYLMLADKTAQAPTDGLNQKFRFVQDNNRHKGVEVSASLDEEDLSVHLLRKIGVDLYCDQIYNEKDGEDDQGRSFVERVNYYAEHYSNDNRIPQQLKARCRNCEFFASNEERTARLKSGFHECWKAALHWNDRDFEEPNILDLWNFRKKDAFIQEGKIKFSQIHEEDIAPPPSKGSKLTTKERQWLQIEKEQNGDKSFWLDRNAMRAEIKSWTYPLHFIDFETTMMAIPFNKGRHPYEGIAFQYSHHQVHQDGAVDHKGEYLNTEQGLFPNYEFVRGLKAELDKDEGTILRYSAHENTYLNLIYRQLQSEQDEIVDRKELGDFIKTISHSRKDSVEKWVGERDMVDLLELSKWYYYNPLTKGSNSIKHVLPATLNSSDFLKQKYAQPICGAEDGISSHNFRNHQWIQIENGAVSDPYKQLPELFVGADKMSLMSDGDELKDGGAAMTAYAKMQFEDMSDYERKELRAALLRYCELDTLAMVMIYEAWVDWVK